jgi:release factor glutamine methyltransferase
MPTIAEVLQQASAKLRTAEVLNDLLDAQTLLAHALGKERTYLIIHYNQILAEDLLATYQALIDRRAAGEPLQYIVEHQEFYGLEFEVTPAVLIPRPETELIIEETIRLAANLSEPLIIDVGTGSGCIAVTLARELETARVIATDISANALQVARRNAQRHGLSDRVQFVETDLLNGLATKADFILSNPPYIASHEMPTLQREVRDWEPHTALTDFGDGLQFYRRLLDEAPARLKPNGVLMFEVGYQQAETIKAFVNRAVWHEPKALRDLQQIERTLMIMLK